MRINRYGKKTVPQWLELDFGGVKSFDTVYLTFDTDLNDVRHCSWKFKDSERMVPESVRDYSVEYFDGKKWVNLIDVTNNYQLRRIHRFPQVKGSKLRITVNQTNGDKSARIFEVRVYDE